MIDQISANLPENRYIKNHPNSKKGIGQWTHTPKCKKDAAGWLESGYNVGFLLGSGYVGLDCDSVEMEMAVEQLIKTETYTQQSAKRGMKHFIFFVPGFDRNLVLDNGMKPIDKLYRKYGEILCSGKQLMIHPSKIDGKQYKILKDLPIAEIKLSDLMAVIDCFCSQLNKNIAKIEKEVRLFSSEIDDVSITDVIPLSGMKLLSNGQYVGCNPWHGSETGENFRITPSKNLAYCFRCDAAISPAKAIALSEHIISSCSDPLRGSDFLKTMEIARQKYGINREKQPDKAANQPDVDILMPWNEFNKIKFNRDDYLVEDHIRPEKIVMVAGPSGQLKSAICQNMAFSLASGRPFLNTFKTKKSNVAWLDKEDGLDEVQFRFRGNMKIYGAKKINNLFILKTPGMLDDPSWREKLKSTIKKNNIKACFFDTMHRFGRYKENSADEINDFYLNVLYPLTETGAAIVLIHHTTKKGDYRGSSDLKGMVDAYYKVYQDKYGNVVFDYEKISYGPKQNRIIIRPTFIKSNPKLKDPDMFIPKLLSHVETDEIRKTKEDLLLEKIIELKLKNKSRSEMITTLKDNKIKFSPAALGRIRTRLKNENITSN